MPQPTLVRTPDSDRARAMPLVIEHGCGHELVPDDREGPVVGISRAGDKRVGERVPGVGVSGSESADPGSGRLVFGHRGGRERHCDRRGRHQESRHRSLVVALAGEDYFAVRLHADRVGYTRGAETGSPPASRAEQRVRRTVGAIARHGKTPTVGHPADHDVPVGQDPHVIGSVGDVPEVGGHDPAGAETGIEVAVRVVPDQREIYVRTAEIAIGFPRDHDLAIGLDRHRTGDIDRSTDAGRHQAVTAKRCVQRAVAEQPGHGKLPVPAGPRFAHDHQPAVGLNCQVPGAIVLGGSEFEQRVAILGERCVQAAVGPIAGDGEIRGAHRIAGPRDHELAVRLHDHRPGLLVAPAEVAVGHAVTAPGGVACAGRCVAGQGEIGIGFRLLGAARDDDPAIGLQGHGMGDLIARPGPRLVPEIGPREAFEAEVRVGRAVREKARQAQGGPHQVGRLPGLSHHDELAVGLEHGRFPRSGTHDRKADHPQAAGSAETGVLIQLGIQPPHHHVALGLAHVRGSPHQHDLAIGLQGQGVEPLAVGGVEANAAVRPSVGPESDDGIV